MALIAALQIDHIVLQVTDLAAARDYYTGLFGFRIQPYSQKQTILMVESPAVHFFLQESDVSPEYLRQQHLSLRVEDYNEVIDILQANHIAFETGVFSSFEFQNYRWVEWRDPNGIRLECVEIVVD